MAQTQPPPTSVTSDTSDVRVNLRGFFAVTLVVALTAAITGALMRQQDRVEPAPVAALWLGIIAGSVVGTLLAVWNRRRLERRAGRIVARCRLTHFLLPPIIQVLDRPFTALGVLYILGVTVAISVGVGTGNLGTTSLIPYFIGGLVWMILAYSFASDFWRRSVRLCENGIVYTNRFYPWTKIKGYYWHRRCADVLIFRMFLRRPAMIVRPEDRATVEALLQQMLAS